MNKEAYLNELAQALKMYDKAYVDEIISDYEAHFENGMQQGKSEADICAELGSVRDVIDEIKDLLGEDKLKSFEVARGCAPIEKSEGGYSYEHYDNDAQFSSESGSSENMLHSFKFQAGNADIRLMPSKDNVLRVYTEDKEEIRYIEASVNDGCYYGRVVPKSGSFLGTNILFGLFGAAVDTVVAEIPDSIEDIEIVTSSGDVFVKEINAENIKFQTASGDISVKKTQSRQLMIKSVSGDVEFKRLRTEGLIVSTTSGDIRYEDMLAHEFSCKTISGDVNGRRLESRSIYVKAVSGDVALNLICPDEGFCAYTKTVSGSVKVKGGIRAEDRDFSDRDMGSDIKVTVETVSGDIKVKAEK